MKNKLEMCNKCCKYKNNLKDDGSCQECSFLKNQNKSEA